MSPLRHLPLSEGDGILELPPRTGSGYSVPPAREQRFVVSNPVVCLVCKLPGVIPVPVAMENREVMDVHLCLMHSDPIRIIVAMASGVDAHRYANPGDRPMSRDFITARDDIDTMDWVAPLADA